jgi:condensin-2 complex subunit G2
MKDLVSEHASDITSSAVRVEAVNAITRLLEAPQSHAVLREILPSIGNLIHDKVEKVRLAVVRMLLRIKKIPNIKYYHIVPLEHLTARFVEEAKGRSPTNTVAEALTSLMVNSYFPDGSNSDGHSTEPIRRALQFCTDEPEAALVFYANVYKHRSFHSIAQLTIQLIRCLYKSVQEQMKRDHVEVKSKATTISKRRRRCNEFNDDEENANDKDVTPPIEVMATIAEVISTLWQSIETQLHDHVEWNQFLMEEFSGPKLSTILTYYENKASNISTTEHDTDDVELILDDCYRICSAMLLCAGRLPSKAVDGLVSNVVSSLQMVSASFENRHHQQLIDSGTITAYLALLCTWDMTDAVISSIATSIRSELSHIANHSPLSILGSPVAIADDSKKRRSSNRRKENNKACREHDSSETITIPPLPVHIVLSVLDNIFVGADPSSIAARKAITSTKNRCDDIELALKDGMKCVERILDRHENSRMVRFTLRVGILSSTLVIASSFFHH